MFYRIFLITVLFCSSNARGNVRKELGRLEKMYDDFDPACFFNYTQVDSNTIQHFPKCQKVFGILVFNDKTKMTVEEMQPYFENMGVLSGGLVVENSTLQSLSLFTWSESYITIDCEIYGVHILNNSYLTDRSTLDGIFMKGDDHGKECDIEIVNNVNLNTQSLPDDGFFYYFTDLRVRGNLKNWGCVGDEINDHTLQSYEDCQKTTLGLKLNNLTSVNPSSLSNIYEVRGVVNISNTHLEDLSFLKSLKTLRIRNQATTEKVYFNLENNRKMTRLRLPEFKEFHNTEGDGLRLFNFENLHTDFCLTLDEINFFLKNEVAFQNLHAKICGDSRSEVGGKRVCRFSTMKELPDDCYMIIGDVLVDSEDDEDFEKFQELKYLFGSLTIQNTTLENLEQLSELAYIVYLGEGPMIRMVDNKDLIDVNLENLQNVLTRGDRTAVIQNNHPDIFKMYEGVCALIESTDMFRIYRTRMTFVGGNCGENIDASSRKSMSWMLDGGSQTRDSLFFVLCNFLIYRILCSF